MEVWDTKKKTTNRILDLNSPDFKVEQPNLIAVYPDL